MTQRKRRILDKFVIGEVSNVDRPAQEGALASIVKSADGDFISKAIATLEKVHDEAPARARRRIAEIITHGDAIRLEKREDMDTPAFARLVASELRSRLDEMADAFMQVSGVSRQDAEAAVANSTVGKDMADMLTIAQDIAGVQKSKPVRSVATEAIQARDDIDSELDKMARTRQSEKGGDFYSNYEAVCQTHEGLSLIRKRDTFQALSTGTAEHGRVRDVTKVAHEPGLGVDENLDRRLTAANSGRALMKRAREIQVQRRDPRLSLVDALALAKAEAPNIAKSANI